jgi:beta-1,2-mannobiose phosphorylase / 1,2-beta-oligomannan phosphorylase
MIEVNKLGILLHKTTLAFEAEGVLNPAVIKVGNEIHMFYRAVGKGNHSTIGYCLMSDPMTVKYRNESPVIFPESEEENHGVEDPRIVWIEGTYYLTYTAYDGVNALGSLATSTDLIQWEKKGVIVPQITYKEFKRLSRNQGGLEEKYIRFNEYHKDHGEEDTRMYIWDKNLMFFPRKIDNTFWLMHRIKPGIQIAPNIESLDKLTPEYWKKYLSEFKKYKTLAPRHAHEVSYIGGGCPPIETKAGWLIIYHGVHDTVNGYVYSACAALLDLANPQIEIARLPYPLFYPEKEWELNGEVDNVCFPSGSIVENDTLFIYYGAADERIAVASVSLQGLIDELLLHTL